MVECSQCRQWYHTDCVNVPKIALGESDVNRFCTIVLSRFIYTHIFLLFDEVSVNMF